MLNMFIYQPNQFFSAEYGAVIDDPTAIDKINTFIARAPFSNQGFNCGGFVSVITYWSAFDFYCTMTWQNQDSLGHVEPYGLANVYREITNDDKFHHHRVTNVIEDNYSPYFDVGGIYTVGMPCDKTNNKSQLKNPFRYSLSQNYPNPFNPKTIIIYEIPKDETVKISVYDITGRLVINLVDEFKLAGNYSVSFDGANLASGLYIYEIKAGSFTKTKKMLLIK